MWIHRGFGSVPQKSGGDCRAACKRLTLPTELSCENYMESPLSIHENGHRWDTDDCSFLTSLG